MTMNETARKPAADAKSNGRADDERLSHFRPLQLRKAADVIADVLVDAIRNGLFHPGDRLPRERDLAARLEVSRTTLREGIGILQRARVLNVRRGNGGGVFVATRVIPATLLETAHTLGRYAEVRSILEVRRPLELLAAVLATRRATEAEVRELSDLTDLLEPLSGSDEEFMHLDFQIHMRLAEASQNPILVAYIDDLLKQLAAIRFEYPVVTFSPLDAVGLHRRMLRAIMNRDEQGVFAAVDEHLGRVELHMLGERLTPADLHDLGRAVL
jgi:GntR family transcriptional repressor for pyruvate dehydrogenase complex